MTAADWHLTADPFALLDHLFPPHGSGSTPEQPRKLRLYFCALARRAWDVLPGPLRATLDVAERTADDVEESRSARTVAVLRIAREYQRFTGEGDDIETWSRQLREAGVPVTGPTRVPRRSEEDCQSYALLVGLPLEPNAPNYRWVKSSYHRADLVRDVFERPEMPVSFDPSWRSATAVEFARGMYRARNFSAMPALGDLLEEAGCDHDGVLRHCRDARGVHTRGCWVVDRLIAHNAAALAGLSDRDA